MNSCQLHACLCIISRYWGIVHIFEHADRSKITRHYFPKHSNCPKGIILLIYSSKYEPLRKYEIATQ